MKKKINIFLFGAVIYVFFVGYMMNFDFEDLRSLQAVKNYFSGNVACKDSFIDLYGAFQWALGKSTIEDFTLFKNGYGKIVDPVEVKSQDDIITKIQEIEPIFAYLEEKQIPYYYMTSLLPIVDEKDLPIGVEDYSKENATLLLQELQKRAVSVFDLREQEAIIEIDKEALFYKTDHHWSLQTCFVSFREIVKEIEAELQWKLDANDKYTNIEEYYELRDNACFLGSYGVKVGKYYAGKDDFVVYIPNASPDYTFAAYDTERNLILQEDGDFLNALMDVEIVNDTEYNNKYNAFLNNCSIENHIINNSTDNTKKVLLISHSYGRPLAQYLSLCFKEVRMLDPQEGRFDGNYLQYIEEYQPDLVLFLVEFEGEIIGNYCVE